MYEISSSDSFSVFYFYLRLPAPAPRVEPPLRGLNEDDGREGGELGRDVTVGPGRYAVWWTGRFGI